MLDRLPDGGVRVLNRPATLLSARDKCLRESGRRSTGDTRPTGPLRTRTNASEMTVRAQSVPLPVHPSASRNRRFAGMFESRQAHSKSRSRDLSVFKRVVPLSGRQLPDLSLLN